MATIGPYVDSGPLRQGFRRSLNVVLNRSSLIKTFSQPRQLMKRLFGVKDVEEIVEDGAPSGKKDYLVSDTFSVKDMDPRVAKLGPSGPTCEAINLMIFLMMRGVRVILFCKVRATIQT
ncbi:uncharacterized protein HD556DRAFT_1451933 [Suillus plorans]|uniref:Uncharacterized protein n=1 Tax=Suillus plorans TaxID=116603 RepID=A0A9P7D9T2_9AGAM|nr:uncharacterized protein HD556DRAFT_1451933 [Suillus plorans]KAG1784308.1 hypothetical protein HD556DRAFT_1451933 [Suillus plorans]KAG1806037.1 hypothetical protein EV424DRAFT_1544114 [Suillus variegatus]